MWVPHGPNCICRPCRLARMRAERLANRPRPTRSDEAAEKIAGLAQGEPSGCVSARVDGGADLGA